MHTAVDEEVNHALKKLGLRPIKCNPDTKKVYAASMDGTSVEALLKDLALALVDATPITDDWGLITSPSVFLRGVAMACRKCGSKGKTQYGQLVKALPLLRHWVIGMGLAMRMRPEEGDYNKVKEHLALYVVSKTAPLALLEHVVRQRMPVYDGTDARRLGFAAPHVARRHGSVAEAAQRGAALGQLVRERRRNP